MTDPLLMAKEREVELTEALALISLMARNDEPGVLVRIKEMAEAALKEKENGRR